MHLIFDKITLLITNMSEINRLIEISEFLHHPTERCTRKKLLFFHNNYRCNRLYRTIALCKTIKIIIKQTTTYLQHSFTRNFQVSLRPDLSPMAFPPSHIFFFNLYSKQCYLVWHIFGLHGSKLHFLCYYKTFSFIPILCLSSSRHHVVL